MIVCVYEFVVVVVVEEWLFSSSKTARQDKANGHQSFDGYGVCFYSLRAVVILFALSLFLSLSPQHLINPNPRVRCMEATSMDGTGDDENRGHVRPFRGYLFLWCGDVGSLVSKKALE